MKTLTALSELTAVPGPVHLAVGFFDGVHLGHQEVIRRAQATAAADGGTAVVVTFDPHPMKVLRPETAPRLLTSTHHKQLILERLGVSHLLIIPFNETLATLSPEAFIRDLSAAAPTLASITVGRAWVFGHGRSGNLATLTALGNAHKFGVFGVAPVIVADEPVSSTRARLAVERGDFPAAARLLGREYSILGTVIQGRQLARKLGFPTANLALEAEQLPPIGVYAVKALVEGRQLYGVANLGLRPTVEDGAVARHFEVHLFDFTGDLYGTTVEVRFVQRLRDEMKMETLDDLKAQIARDAQQARALFGDLVPA